MSLLIHQLLKPELIDLAIKTTERKLLFGSLLDLINKNGLVKNMQAIQEDLAHFEKNCICTIGDGVALPYIRSHALLDNFIAFGKTKIPIDWGANDGEPIRFVIFTGSLYQEFDFHIQLLAKLSRLMRIRTFRLKLINLRTPQDVIETFKIQESSELELF
jgi:fructose PTS system EIIBC or EIIC component